MHTDVDLLLNPFVLVIQSTVMCVHVVMVGVLMHTSKGGIMHVY